MASWHAQVAARATALWTWSATPRAAAPGQAAAAPPAGAIELNPVRPGPLPAPAVDVVRRDVVEAAAPAAAAAMVIDLTPARHPLAGLAPKQLSVARGRLTRRDWLISVLPPAVAAVAAGLATGAYYARRWGGYPQFRRTDCGSYDACIPRLAYTTQAVNHTYSDKVAGLTYTWTTQERTATPTLGDAASAACYALIEACLAQEPERRSARDAASAAYDADVARGARWGALATVAAPVAVWVGTYVTLKAKRKWQQRRLLNTLPR